MGPDTRQLRSLQNRITAELEVIDGPARFVHDSWDRPGGGYDHYEMRIAERECHLIEPDGAPDLTLKIRPTDLRKLIVGETGVRRLALMGRLRAVGDLGLGMQLGDLFDF